MFTIKTDITQFKKKEGKKNKKYKVLLNAGGRMFWICYNLFNEPFR